MIKIVVALYSNLISICIAGMIIAYAEGAFLHWRLVSWLNIGYTIIPCILVQFFVPESPVWLVSKGRIEDARKSLSYLYKAYPQPEHTVSVICFPFGVIYIATFFILRPKHSLKCICVPCKGKGNTDWRMRLKHQKRIPVKRTSFDKL